MTRERHIPWIPLDGISPRLYCEAIRDDTEGLHVLLRGPEPISPILRLLFESPVGYRNINESFRTKTWADLDMMELPSLLTVENSRWLAWLVDEAGGVLRPESLVHYAVFTAEDCIDVVTEFPPIAEWLTGR